MSISWKKLESSVRELASLKWNCQVSKDNIAGVDFDAVLEPEHGRKVLIEITENNTLDKVRNDITRLSLARTSLMQTNTMCECYIILSKTPTQSMIDAGKSLYIKILSFDQFKDLFLNYNIYITSRKRYAFGSAVDPFTGNPDAKEYTPVLYKHKGSEKNITLNDIIKFLENGKSVVLLGNYGTGKSRCFRELFNKLSSSNDLNYTFALNLKDNWGIKRAEEMIRRHLDDLGLSDMSDSSIKILNSNTLTILLDGFDELGAQTWSDNPAVLNKIRRESLQAVKDLISKLSRPVFITGREHYFNSDQEILDAVGLKAANTVFIECKEEFSEDEFNTYLKKIKYGVNFPTWLPRRPLICQIISELDDETLITLSSGNPDEVKFWHTLIKLISEREARIKTLLDAQTIKSVLEHLANITREKVNNVGPLSFTEIIQAFKEVTSTSPDDASAIMLQRLSGLGRVSSEGNDRQFVDLYILDGLRADYLIKSIEQFNESIFSKKWINPISTLGCTILSNFISSNSNLPATISYFRKSIEEHNRVLSGDILASLVEVGKKTEINLTKIILSGTHIENLDLSHSNCHNFTITDSIIENLNISNCKHKNIFIKSCQIQKVYGVSSHESLPSWISNCSICEYENLKNSTGIKEAKLSIHHQLLITILQRTFFQRGKARKIETLYRGFEAHKNEIDSIIKLLISDSVVEKIQGGESYYIKPKMNKSQRMQKLIGEMSLAGDELWGKVGSLFE